MLKFQIAVLGLSILLIGCSLPRPEGSFPPSEVDRPITHMLTDEDSWPDIKINYYAVRGDGLCYEAMLDNEVWYGMASLIEGEWYVTWPQIDLINSRCSRGKAAEANRGLL